MKPDFKAGFCLSLVVGLLLAIRFAPSAFKDFKWSKTERSTLAQPSASDESENSSTKSSPINDQADQAETADPISSSNLFHQKKKDQSVNQQEQSNSPPILLIPNSADQDDNVQQSDLKDDAKKPDLKVKNESKPALKEPNTLNLNNPAITDRFPKDYAHQSSREKEPNKIVEPIVEDQDDSSDRLLVELKEDLKSKDQESTLLPIPQTREEAKEDDQDDSNLNNLITQPNDTAPLLVQGNQQHANPQSDEIKEPENQSASEPIRIPPAKSNVDRTSIGSFEIRSYNVPKGSINKSRTQSSNENLNLKSHDRQNQSIQMNPPQYSPVHPYFQRYLDRKEYFVRIGDTLESIAMNLYQDRAMASRIREANRHLLIDPDDQVQPGIVLRLPRLD